MLQFCTSNLHPSVDNRLEGARKAKDLVLNELEEALSLKGMKGSCCEPSCRLILPE